MTGRHLLTRTLITLGLTVVVYLVIGALSAQATPIKPDARKLAEQPEPAPFVPARVGWEGSNRHLVQDPINPLLESISPERVNREFQDTVLELAIPDPWLVTGCVVLVLLLRRLLYLNRKRAQIRPSDAVPERVAA